MKANFRSCWQYIRKHWIVAIIIVFVVVMVLIFVGYWFNWTGFNGYNKVTITHTIRGTNAGTATRTEEYQPGKSLWDWLQLLIAPAVVSLAGLWFTRVQQQRDKRLEQLQHERDQQLADQRAQSEREAADKRAQTEREIASDNQREAALQSYINNMSELLLEKDNPLRESQPEDEVRKIARVRTLTVLRRLDAERKGNVVRFLQESGLIDKDKRIIDLHEADLHEAHLERANLHEAVLYGADLSGAYLSRASLLSADLSAATLSKAHLERADLRRAALLTADLSGANLSEANLSEARLRSATLLQTNLSQANLSGATLLQANLSGADLSGADLSGAYLKAVSGIIIEELETKAYSLRGTTRPDGSIHS